MLESFRSKLADLADFFIIKGFKISPEGSAEIKMIREAAAQAGKPPLKYLDDLEKKVWNYLRMLT